MTSSIIASNAPSFDPIQMSQAANPPPRKRRRRTGAKGAGDDCFTCTKRGVGCDRKRPYCSQCLEIGKECTGYKTTLTWGVGVASRGKLRGLSCPIANKNLDGSDASPEQIAERRRKSSAASRTKGEAVGSTTRANATSKIQPVLPDAIFSRAIFPSQTIETSPLAIPQSHNSWPPPPQHSNEGPMKPCFPHGVASLGRIHTAISPFSDIPSAPGSASSVNSFSDTEYGTPLEYPQAAGPFVLSMQDMPTSHPQDNLNAGHDDRSVVFEHVDNGPSWPPTSTVVSDAPLAPRTFSYVNEEMIFGQLEEPANGFDVLFEGDDTNFQDRGTTVLNGWFGDPFAHLSSRMRTLLDYYDRNICPFLVAFDSPANPYRLHVLQLAVHNEGLQNAIAALSTNNIRMRAKTPRQLCYVGHTNGTIDGREHSPDSGPTPEETIYKQMSIDQLNMHLTDPRAAHDDSVLATLLILCLFHVCDSGFSKFKTQLAGVQKLLSMRNRSQKSNFEGWVEMFFTWFDVMTSTVNDREVQITGESLDMLNFNTNLGALEEFSGCDGRLFKLIARLGRLNLLAQGRPVRGQASTPQTEVRPTFASAAKRSLDSKRRSSTKWKAPRSLHPQDYANIDGNGWGTPILSPDQGSEASDDDVNDETLRNNRKEFWQEWFDIRSRLHQWEMDISSLPIPPSKPVMDHSLPGSEHLDLAHINEAFRYSALLYTERLGNPLLPSSHELFQKLVTEVINHISTLPITSCVNKFLLWPLFIAGTECVNEDHRNIIRARCIEVQRESGFYNNLSGLEVLERAWREVGSNGVGGEVGEITGRRRDSGAKKDGRYGQAFRWRNAMDRVDGEYILI